MSGYALAVTLRSAEPRFASTVRALSSIMVGTSIDVNTATYSPSPAQRTGSHR
jgi:hypothetical protein